MSARPSGLQLVARYPPSGGTARRWRCGSARPVCLVPDDGGLALVGDADGGDVRRRRADAWPWPAAATCRTSCPDFVRVMLHPAGLREELGEFPLSYGCTFRPAASKRMQRLEVVPASNAITYFAIELCLPLLILHNQYSTKNRRMQSCRQKISRKMKKSGKNPRPGPVRPLTNPENHGTMVLHTVEVWAFAYAPL